MKELTDLMKKSQETAQVLKTRTENLRKCKEDFKKLKEESNKLAEELEIDLRESLNLNRKAKWKIREVETEMEKEKMLIQQTKLKAQQIKKLTQDLKKVMGKLPSRKAQTPRQNVVNKKLSINICKQDAEMNEIDPEKLREYLTAKYSTRKQTDPLVPTKAQIHSKMAPGPIDTSLVIYRFNDFHYRAWNLIIYIIEEKDPRDSDSVNLCDELFANEKAKKCQSAEFGNTTAEEKTNTHYSYSIIRKNQSLAAISKFVVICKMQSQVDFFMESLNLTEFCSWSYSDWNLKALQYFWQKFGAKLRVCILNQI